MKINLAKSAGFCFGVRRALNIAFEAVRKDTRIEMLGDIVHNDEAVKEIIQAGIKKIKRLSKGNNNTLLIRAHGTSLKTYKQAKALGYKIIDATCPMVKEIHIIARRSEKNGYKVIIIGDKKHDEVQGIIGQLKNKAIIIDHIKNIPIKKIRGIKKAAVIVQSTQDLEKTLGVVARLKEYIRELKFSNTICKPTRIKQEELKLMSRKNQLMIIIGSKTSANTKRLYKISRAINKRSYWIRTKEEIRPKWFRNAKTVGITAGASTPESTTKEIIRYIKGLKRQG